MGGVETAGRRGPAPRPRHERGARKSGAGASRPPRGAPPLEVYGPTPPAGRPGCIRLEVFGWRRKGAGRDGEGEEPAQGSSACTPALRYCFLKARESRLEARREEGLHCLFPQTWALGWELQPRPLRLPSAPKHSLQQAPGLPTEASRLYKGKKQPVSTQTL